MMLERRRLSLLSVGLCLSVMHACGEDDTGEQAAGDTQTGVVTATDTATTTATETSSDSETENETQTQSETNTSTDSNNSLSRCEQIQKSVQDAGFSDDVTVTCDDTYAYLRSDTYPDHVLMTGIVGSNEQTAVPADWSAPVKLNPVGTAGRTSIDAAVGVAVNGVPIYDYSSQGDLDLENYDSRFDTVVTQQLDICNGHAGRGDDYHYHAAPNCMMEMMLNKADSSAILGWGFDGYPLYGFDNPDGSALEEGQLDVCNGQADDVYGYRYHTTASPPYIIQCLVGQVDVDAVPRVRPLSPGKPAGTPPQGGVDNLVFTQESNGLRTMTYSYQGNEYYINYTPTGGDCYSFDMDTVSFGRVEAEYCR